MSNVTKEGQNCAHCCYYDYEKMRLQPNTDGRIIFQGYCRNNQPVTIISGVSSSSCKSFKMNLAFEYA